MIACIDPALIWEALMTYFVFMLLWASHWPLEAGIYHQPSFMGWLSPRATRYFASGDLTRQVRAQAFSPTHCLSCGARVGPETNRTWWQGPWLWPGPQVSCQNQSLGHESPGQKGESEDLGLVERVCRSSVRFTSGSDGGSAPVPNLCSSRVPSLPYVERVF